MNLTAHALWAPLLHQPLVLILNLPGRWFSPAILFSILFPTGTTICFLVGAMKITHYDDIVIGREFYYESYQIGFDFVLGLGLAWLFFAGRGRPVT